MNFFVVVLLLALAVGAGLGFLIQLDPGYVRVSWLNWLIETNIWVGLGLLVTFYLALYLVFKFLAKTFAVKSGVIEWRQNVKHHRAQRRTTRGLVEYAEGNWKKAQRYLSASADKSDTPLINYLAAAQAANELGNEKESDQLLQKAYASTPGGEVAIGVTQAQLQLARGQLEQCLSTLLKLRKRTSHHPFVLKLLQQVYLRLNDWQKLSELLPELRKYKVLREDEIDKLEREAWIQLLHQGSEEALRSTSDELNTQPLNNVWDKMPSHLRKSDLMVKAYANHLVKLGASGHAETLIRKHLKQQWSEELIITYGEIEGADASEQLISAEGWLKSRPNDAALLLTLGRLCMRNELWGKAREYYEASLKLKPSAESYAELGSLMSHLKQPEAGNQYLLQALSLAQEHRPIALPMPAPKTELGTSDT